MNDLALAFRRILEVLDRLEVPYCMVGSVASSVHGASIPELSMLIRGSPRKMFGPVSLMLPMRSLMRLLTA
jgi:hypothetical protein